MNPTRILLALVIVSSSACAQIQSGPYATPISRPGGPRQASAPPQRLLISAGELEELASEYFGAIALTFENQTAEWIRIDRVTLDFGGDGMNALVAIPSGADLEAWRQATQQRNAIHQSNVSAAAAVVAFGGSAVAVVGGRSAAGSLGAMAAAGAMIGAAAQSVTDQMAEASAPSLYPETHLFAVPFGVPPGLFAKKWIVFNTGTSPGTPCVQSAVLSYHTTDGHEDQVRFRFRFRAGQSLWQQRLCRSQGQARTTVVRTLGPTGADMSPPLEAR